MNRFLAVVVLSFLSGTIVAVVLSVCSWAQTPAPHDHVAMQNSLIELKGDDIPDLDAQRVVLTGITDADGDNDQTKAAKKSLRGKMDFNDDRSVAALNHWAKANQAASDRYNQKVKTLLSANGINNIEALNALETALGEQQQSAIDALSSELTAAGHNPMIFKAFATRYKADHMKKYVEADGVSTRQKAHLEYASRKLKRVTQRGTTYQSGYTVGWLLNMDNTYVYGVTTLVGHASTTNWTCQYNSRLGEWMPYPGCQCTGGGIPCHNPTLTTYIGSSYTTFTWGGQPPSYDWNLTMGNQNTLANGGTVSFTANVWCTAANAYYVNAQYGREGNP